MFYFFLLVYAQFCQVFIVDPVSIAANDGTTVEFTCTANNSLDLSFRVNGSAVLQSVFNEGFQQLPIAEELGYKVFGRNLTVIVSSLHNNTKIHCKAHGSQMVVKSKVAALTVQGFERTKIF